MIATSVAGLGLSAYQMIDSAEQANQAEKALDAYNRQELKNVAENLSVSTLGADRMRESQAQLSAGQIDSLRGGGARAIIGGAGRVDANNQLVNANISANLDEQQKEIDRMKAGDEANIRAIQEGRENADIGALSSQYNAGAQNFQQGMGNAVQSAGMLANNINRNANPNEGTTLPIGDNSNYTVSGQGVDYSNPNNMSPVSDRYNANNKYNVGWGTPSVAPPSYMMNPYNQNMQNYNPFGFGGRGMFGSNNPYVTSN